MEIIDKALHPFIISTDQYQFIIEELVEGKISEEDKVVEVDGVRYKTKQRGYHTSLSTALDKVLKLRLNKNLGVVDLKGYLTEVRDMREDLLNILKSFD